MSQTHCPEQQAPQAAGDGRFPAAGRPGWAVARDFVLGVSLFLLLEAVIFRGHLYSRYLAPKSCSGQILARTTWVEKHPPSDRQEILLMGDSRIAEGFSAKLADKVYQNFNLAFINASVPGTTPRVWHYLLRELDPTADRYAAVLIPLQSYDDGFTPENVAARRLDMSYLTPLVGYADLLDYARSFPDQPDRADALTGGLLKGFAYQKDVQDFLQAPRKRLQEVRANRGDLPYDYHYVGHPESLAGLGYDPARKQFSFPPNLTAVQKKSLEDYLALSRAKPYPNATYVIHWLRKILRRYEDSPTRLVLVRMPRGPVVPATGRPEQSVIAERFRATPNVTVLDARLCDDLEKPELFFDALHLNAAGRRLFTVRMARSLAKVAGCGSEEGEDCDRNWVRTGPDDWTLPAELLAADPDAAEGVYPQEGGLSFVQPVFNFSLPARVQAGVARVRGYLPPSFSSLLPLTVTASAPGRPEQSIQITQPGTVTLEIPCAPAPGGGPARITVKVDKTLVPRELKLGEDVRRLSFGVTQIEYRAGGEPAAAPNDHTE